MAKIVLDTVTGGYDLSVINNNFDKIETELQNKVLYRNNPLGETNTLETDVDVNGKRIYNLPEPLLASEAARLQDLQNAVAGAAANLITFTPYGHVAGNNVQAAVQELIDDTTNNGVALPAFLKDSNTIVVDSIASLKAIDKTKFTKAQVLGYYTKGDGGGGVYWFDPSDTASADNSGTIIVATDLGRWKLVLQGSVSVKQFGAKGDGLTPDDPAFIAASAVSGTVNIPAGTYRFSASATLASEKQWRFDSGAKISVDVGQTLTISGVVFAGWGQIFSGLGVVTGIKKVRPEWFGAKGDGVTDDSAALQAASNCVANSFGSDGSLTEIEMGKGAFLISSTWTLYPQQNTPLRITGCGVTGTQGTRIIAGTSFSGTSAILVAGQTGALAPIADWSIDSIAILPKTVGLGPSIGIQIGEVNKSLIGLQMNNVSNVYVSEFAIGIRIAQARLISFNRCSVWGETVASAKGVVITVDANTSAGFTGDIVFRDCQFVGTNASSRINVEIISNNAGQTGISGIKFFGCTFYKSVRGISMFVGAGCNISDVWVGEGCQFDGTSTHGIVIDAKQTGSVSYINDLRVENSYFQGVSEKNIWIDSGNNGEVKYVQIINNWFNGSNSSAIQAASKTDGVVIQGNIFSDFDISTLAVVEMLGPVGFTVTGNVLKRTAAQVCGYFISAQSGCNHFVIANNTAGGIPTSGIVRDLSGAVTKAVVNNI